MEWKSKIGVYAYRIRYSKIEYIKIIEGRETIRQDRLLDSLIEYRFEGDASHEWSNINDVYFTKEDIIKSL
jgi:hypothetical protein